ncbi:MAG TPA: hypothetical protein VHM67_09430, partial [Gemmatimonadaceae bacterium]|nr:hypothetical protein [Gemmatimonadaceae bacterium]
TFWLLRSSPLSMHDLLWSKFWVGTLPLLALALGIVGATNYLLKTSEFIMWVSLFSIVLLTFAIAGMAIGFGTLYPQFETENAAQIPTSFGGLVFMMSAVGIIGGTIILEARPVYAFLSARMYRTEVAMTEVVVGFSLAALLCISATVIPIRIALRRMEATERG